jgi:hypothetical protein
VLGVVLNEDLNVVFEGLTLLGGGMFVHVGNSGSPMAAVQITLASVTSSGNAIVNGYLKSPVSRGGGLMAVISSGSNLTASSVSLAHVNVSNNTGTGMCAL